MHPRPTPLGPSSRAATAALGLALLAGGCNVNRINHLHTPANQARAETARNLFDSVQSDGDGLLAKTMANLEAERNLRRAVASASDEFFDLADVESLGAMDWDGLRERTYSSLGATAPKDFEQLAFIVAHPDRFTVEDRRDAAALLHLGAQLRTQFSAQPAVLDAMWRDHISSNTVALLQRSGADAQIGNGFPRTAAAFEPALASLTPEDATDSIRTSYALFANILGDRPLLDPEDSGLDRAAELMRAWAGLESSAFEDALGRRNDALARVLVLYETLVKGERARAATLVAAQARIREQAKADFHDQVGSQERITEASTASAPRPDTLDKTLELLDSLRTGIRNVWEDEQIREAYLARSSQAQRELLAVAADSRDPASVYSLVPMLGEGLGDEELTILGAYITSLQEKVAALPPTPPSESEVPGSGREAQRAVRARNEFREAVDVLRTMFGGGEIDIVQTLDSILEATEALNLDLAVADVERARQLAAELQEPVNALVRSGRSGTVSAADARSLLDLALGADASSRLATELEPAAEVVEHVRLLISEVSQQNAEASARVVEFLVGLHALRQGVHDENARHYMVLTTIAKAEVERWLSVRSFSDRLEQVYQHSPTDPNSLFDPGDPPAAGAAPPRPRVTTSTPVIHTLRLLAEEAQTRNTTSPSRDLDGLAAAQSAARLTNAIRAISIQQLLSATNRRAANRNSIALIGEVREHSARLDDILASGVELEIRYHMDELVAFHSTGVTEQDLQNLIGAVQQGILIWIGSEQ